MDLNAYAEWFCGLLGDPGFRQAYEGARRRYVRDTRNLFIDLDAIPRIKAFPSAANFALLELDRPAASLKACAACSAGPRADR